MENGDTDWLDFDYGEFDSAEIDMGDGDDTTQIWGTTASMTDGFTLDGDGGNDAFSVHPRDSAGNPTIGGALQINGGLGLDNVAIDNAMLTLGEDYTIFGLLDFTTISSPTLANVTTGSDVELLDLRAAAATTNSTSPISTRPTRNSTSKATPATTR